MRLNLGCGDYPLPGWINVDCRDLPGVDLVTDARHLPFADHSIGAVYAGHLLEHLEPEDGLAALREWWRVLEPGGSLTVVTPDVLVSQAWFDEGRMSRVEYEGVLFGGEAAGPQHHRACYSASILRSVLLLACDDYAAIEPVEFRVGPDGQPTDRRLVSAIGWQCGWTVTKASRISGDRRGQSHSSLIRSARAETALRSPGIACTF